MKHYLFMLILAVMITLIMPISTSNAQESSNIPEVEGNIYELALRYVLDQERFVELSSQLEELIADYPAEVVIYSGEFNSIFGLAPELEVERPIQLGISQYTSAEDYFTMGENLIDDPIVEDYFTTIETIQNVLMIPANGEVDDEAVDASELSECGALEVAVRDISEYSDVEDFNAKMDAFIDLLGSQEGVVREYQFISLDGTYFVGMTCYDTTDSFMAISSDPTVLEDQAVTTLFAEYPPLVAQLTIPIDTEEQD